MQKRLPGNIRALSKGSRIGPADNMDWLCERFMKMLKRDFRGHKVELSPMQITNRTKRFCKAFGIANDGILIHALMIRGWLEPSAADTYIVRYDMV